MNDYFAHKKAQKAQKKLFLRISLFVPYVPFCG
jgi:hypothetical protein